LSVSGLSSVFTPALVEPASESAAGGVANLDEVGGQLLSANPADMMNFMVGEDATEATSTADD